MQLAQRSVPSALGFRFHADKGCFELQANKPVVLEEYGLPTPGNHSVGLGPWQATVLRSGLAADSVWQFGASGTSVNPATLADLNTVYYDSSEFQQLGREQAQNMMNKKVPGAVRGRRRARSAQSCGRGVVHAPCFPYLDAGRPV